MQIYVRHSNGRPLSDQQVADFYLDALEYGEPVGCLPTLEVHVDMWSEDFRRIERVGRPAGARTSSCGSRPITRT
jgi:hypothetical protein